MSPEATTAKRKEIAGGIRAAAAKLEGTDKMLHLLESLCYEQDEATMKEALSMADAFADSVKDMPPAKLESSKGEIMKVDSALQYLAKFKLMPDDAKAGKALRGVISKQEWEKKKK
jgi:hypothetical protein